jgi:hypothetical protein
MSIRIVSYKYDGWITSASKNLIYLRHLMLHRPEKIWGRDQHAEILMRHAIEHGVGHRRFRARRQASIGRDHCRTAQHGGAASGGRWS